MYKTNKKRYKYFVLAFADTRRLYKLMHLFIYILVLFSIVIVLVCYWSYFKQKETTNTLFGKWNTVFIDISQNDILYFKKHAYIKSYSIQKILKKVSVEKNQFITIGSCDNNFLELGNITLLSGNMPINEKEVAIEEQYLSYFDVSKVGDIIENTSIAGTLQGYKVCGILSNYSNRWKMVNWDISYINCFIKDTSNSEDLSMMCFTLLNDTFGSDITTNFLNYRNNLVIPKITLDRVLIYYWICIFLFCCSLKILLIINIKLIKGQKNIRISWKTKKIIRIFFVVLLMINMIYLITLFFNRLVVNDVSRFDLRIIENEKNRFEETLILENAGYIKYISYDNVLNGNVKIVKYVPSKIAMNIVSMVMILFLIIMSNIIIYNYFILFLKEKSEDEYYILKKYYYDIPVIKSNKIKRSISSITGFCLFFYTLLFFIRKIHMEYNTYTFIVYVVGIFIIIFIITLQYFLLKKFCIRRTLDDNNF